MERRLANHYQAFDVHVGSARFDADRGIAIDDVVIMQKGPDGTSQPVLSIEEMYMAGKVRVEQLVTGQMQINDIAIRRAKLRLVHQLDGQWNARALLPLPHFSDQSPQITIEDATATLDDAASPASKPWAIQGIDLKLAPVDASVVAANATKRFQITGTANGSSARVLRIDGEVGTATGELDLTVAAIGLDVSPELLASLPVSTTAKLNGAEVSGRADVKLHLLRAAADAPIGWSAAFRVDRGRLAHARLPEPLTDVALVGHADVNSLVIERLEGKCGPAAVVLALNRAGWSANAPLAGVAKVVGLALGDRLRTSLPESCARVWQRFKPVGTVDAEVRFTFDGENLTPVLSANCRGISLTDAEKFPYPLEQTTGHVEYHPAGNGAADRLHLDLTGVGGGRPVKIEAELSHLAPHEPEGVTTDTGVALDGAAQRASTHAAGYRGVRYARAKRAAPSHPLGYVKITGADIPIHDQLIAALPEKARLFTQSLQAEGAIDFLFRAEWKELSQPQAGVTMEIQLKDCRIQYLPFPYPLHHVQGLATASNWHWTLHDMEGRGGNDSTVVKCRGESIPSGKGYQTDLMFEATNVPLDDNLKLALSPAGQQAWDELRPQGFVNFTAHVTRQPDQLKPAIEVALRPHKRMVSLEPRLFPYRFDQVDGVAHYKDGRVDVQKLSGQHDRTEYSAESCNWQVGPDGSWQFELKNVSVDRLSVTRDLLVALPPALQSTLERLQPAGSFDIHNSSLSFFKLPQSDGMTAAWDVNLECQQAALQGGVPLRGITGGMRLAGRSDGRSAFVAGELALDSLLCKDMQLTNVRGPLWANSSQCLLGEPACQQLNQPPRRLTADAYGGSLATNVELIHDNNPSYKLDVHLGGANLARFANERLGGPNDMNGTVSGKLLVSGMCSSTQTLRGTGELHVVDANIYELPPLVAMLKVLSNRTPNSTAFNRCDMQFSIEGEHIHFQQLNLLGDALSLYGNGESDFNRRLDLVFYTLIGPADLPIPFWKTIAGHVSQQGLQLKVVGTFDHPETERKALPAVNDMLDHIQSEIQGGAATMAPSTAARGQRGPAR